ncbi:MAG TPA: DinB family protein, partial [Chitinophagaceae bacterium]
MKRSAIKPMPEFFDQYINLIDDIELKEAFEKSLLDIHNIDRAAMEAIGDKTYAPGKWTIRDIFQHIIDTERVMSYRALRFARNDKTPLPGFDQDLFTAEAKAGKKTVSALLDE